MCPALKNRDSKVPLSTKDKLTLAIQRSSSQITIGDVNGSREITEVPEGVDVSFRAGRVDRRLSQLPFVSLLDHKGTKRNSKEGINKKPKKQPVKSGDLMFPVSFGRGKQS